jgi:hypothetical protein
MSTHNNIIIDDVLIQVRINDLRLLNEVNDFTKLYIDNVNNEWILYMLYAESVEQDIDILIRKDSISLNSFLDIITQTSDSRIVAAISMLLLKLNFIQRPISSRLRLLEVLENLYNLDSSANKNKIYVCIMETELFDGTNKETIINKHYNVILHEASIYKDIAARAKIMYQPSSTGV